jgi:peroxiredoxin
MLLNRPFQARGRVNAVWVALLALAAVAVAAVSAGGNLIAKTPAPEVIFTSLEGTHTPITSLRGQVVLVTFWATTCTPCLRKMPDLMAMHRRLAPQGFTTMAVAMSYDRPDWVSNYAQRQQPPFPIALDVQGDIARAFEETRATPTIFLVDREGNIVRRWVGETDVAVIERRVREALG